MDRTSCGCCWTPAPRVLSPAEALVVAAMAGDAEAVAKTAPEVVAAARAQAPGQVAVAAARGLQEAVRLLASLGFGVSYRTRATALHEAAWRGDLAMAKLLLDLGADLAARHGVRRDRRGLGAPRRSRGPRRLARPRAARRGPAVRAGLFEGPFARSRGSERAAHLGGEIGQREATIDGL